MDEQQREKLERARTHGCIHPAGCQAPGEGCSGRCPVTPEESLELEQQMYGPRLQGPDPRCEHWRLWLDPCWRCGRRYESGQLVQDQHT